ncbi:MAG: 2-methylfumaryl-CoA hydratase [uncultured Solirubrobacteraceae bacterium]|uniref:2-methylfumaryl-CoA hydratase n=1 Tax=uncultured Solirubrobacteraceae bacterium TaxID=1162706 RepID=A0A6J4SLS6_9ACTN|nr:MAG: 2-methylfumaryl-CoA hydratase [uncultured Solirubrobacteraceae bacterium]
MSAQPTIASEPVQVGGPYWEELSVGARYVEFPAMTLNEGHAALHQSIVGDRLRLALDATLSERVAGRRLAHPMLVCDVSIGQSTLPTQRVIGNLFYRRLMLRRLPAIGDTLKTTTEIVALKRNTIKAGRTPTGLAVLHIVTTDQEDRPILDYWRCAMLPIGDVGASQPHADDLDRFPADLPADALHAPLDGIDLGAYRDAVPGVHFAGLTAPTTWALDGGDSVTAATELVRLSLNLAKAHSDPGSHHSGKRLVYGGHTIGIAAGHLTRTLPNLVTIIGWHHCNHLGPVFEGDVLRSTVHLEGTEALPGGGGLVTLRIEVSAQRADGALDGVLDWRLVGAMA